ncbi:unnamed protein product, partial [Aphanomyces euteiches]
PSITHSMTTCYFAGCMNDSFHNGKCSFHRYHHVCSVDQYMNQAYARRLCVSHGGRRECKADGCTANARSRGFCCNHSLRPPTTSKPSPSSRQSDCGSDSTVHSSVDSLLFEDMLDDDFDLAEMFNPANPFKLTDLEELTVSDEHSLLPVDVNVVDGFLSALPTQTVYLDVVSFLFV